MAKTGKAWKVALNTGANVLALTVIETAGSSSSMIKKRNDLNNMIKEHEEDRLYAASFLRCLEISFRLRH